MASLLHICFDSVEDVRLIVLRQAFECVLSPHG